MFVCLFLFVSWCCLVPFILERREGGRVPRTACEPITYLPPSRPVAATRGAQSSAGARGTPGVVVHRGAGVSEAGKRERGEAEALRGQGSNPLGF